MRLLKIKIFLIIWPVLIRRRIKSGEYFNLVFNLGPTSFRALKIDPPTTIERIYLTRKIFDVS